MIRQKTKESLNDDSPQIPNKEDAAAAKEKYEVDNPTLLWNSLPKRKQNSLIKDEMYSRQYQSLARAIMRK